MAGRAGPRGEYAKTARRREEILDAAFDVFSQSGYLNSTLSEIAKQAGMTMPGLTHHFATKAVLLEAVLRERDIDAGRLLKDRHGVDLLNGLLTIAARDEADPTLTQLYTLLSAEATSEDHPAHQFFQDRYTLILETVTRALEEAAERGDLREGIEPAAAAQMYAALSDGLQLQRLYRTGGEPHVVLIRSFLASLVTPRALDILHAPTPA
ncbi:TetR/AcrR family transcriptional regulator [Microbacterium paludicola]|uniref:TetR/AcrR family transcriptional regulator n=1 Tax=Microbacterium paludicola TaxID=300019 RepID=UPI00143094AF|nr:TetR/AcrR family transcriptional regulator [Microbacterium paludicola]MBF0817696.1 TetR/AcrR family transcriptional regulator [Microbacterium paludicola]